MLDCKTNWREEEKYSRTSSATCTRWRRRGRMRGLTNKELQRMCSDGGVAHVGQAWSHRKKMSSSLLSMMGGTELAASQIKFRNQLFRFPGAPQISRRGLQPIRTWLNFEIGLAAHRWSRLASAMSSSGQFLSFQERVWQLLYSDKHGWEHKPLCRGILLSCCVREAQLRKAVRVILGPNVQ